MKISKSSLRLLKSDIRRMGFACLENSLDDALLQSLCEESSAQRANAHRVSDDGEFSYRGYLADLGNVSRNFLTGRSIGVFLRSLFGQSFVLTRSSSCYTYYQAGDFLDAHRDGADDCEVTVLVYLDAASPNPNAPETGLSLQVYEDRAGEPCKLLHAFKTRRGLLVAGRGSGVWHGRPPLLAGERVSLLTACFSSVA